jgi:hypothetical protein
LDLGDIVIDGSSIPAGLAANEICVLSFSGGDGTSTSVVSDLFAGAKSASVSSEVGFFPDDMILIESNQTFVDGWGNPANKRGEVTFVTTTSAGSISFSPATFFDYDSSENLKITKINALRGLSVTGGKIVAGGAGSIHTGFRVAKAVKPLVENLTVTETNDVAIDWRMVYKGKSRGNSVVNCLTPAPYIAYNSGYGHTLLDGCRDCEIDGASFENCETSTTGGAKYPSLHSTVKNSTNDNNNLNGFTCHEPNFYWSFINCSSRNTPEVGYNLRGAIVTVDGGSSVNAGTNGIRDATFGSNTYGHKGTKIINVTIENPAQNGISVEPAILSGKTKDVTITGCYIYGAGHHGIYVRRADNVKISSCPIIEFNGANLDFIHGIYSQDSSNLTAQGNTVRCLNAGSNRHGFRAQGTIAQNDHTVIGNTFQDCDKAVSIVTAFVDNSIVIGNNGRTCTSATKFDVASTTKVVANNLE